jgi:hypothetical protein
MIISNGGEGLKRLWTKKKTIQLIRIILLFSFVSMSRASANPYSNIKKAMIGF